MSCANRCIPELGFPRREVITLVICVVTHFYSLVSLFPYVGVMAKDMLALDSINEAGFYAGYVASAFTFGRLLGGYAIGSLSDKIGRKPVIIGGLLSIMVFSLAFGLSPNFFWAVSSRFLLGLTNGIMAASRVVTREVCGSRHVVVGMAYLNGGRSMALVLGTSIGGLLATPALHFPDIFPSTGLFARYPFLLPNLVGASLALGTLPLVIFWLPETRNGFGSNGVVEILRVEGKADQEGGEERIPVPVEENSCETLAFPCEHHHDHEDEAVLCGPGGLLRTPILLTLLFMGCITQAVFIGFDECLPLWMLTTQDVGGLGWDTKDIGEVLFITGIILGVLQLGVVPRVIEVVGVIKYSRVGSILCVASLVMIPNASVISWNAPSLFIACVTSALLFEFAIAAVLLEIMIASTNMVPPQQRGMFSGLYNTAESLGRFLGPAGYANIYAFSVSRPAEELVWMDYHFVFYASAVVIVLLTIVERWVFTADLINGASDRMEGGVENHLVSAVDRIAANDESDRYLANAGDAFTTPHE